MSLLNLNSPSGRGSRSRKSSRAWMGVGLLAAVLGFGSTLAANIQINNDETSEFGQGVTRTVYCGGDQEVTIAPISAYVNKVNAAPENSFQTRFALSYFTQESDFTAESGESVPPYSTVNGIDGWWTRGTNTRTLAADQSLAAAKLEPGTYAFTERQRRNGDQEYGYYKINTREFRKVVITPAVEASEASFRTAGVLISDIPEECDYVDFVVSFFGETGAAQTMISGNGVDVKEVAYNWRDRVGTSYTVSRSRTSFVPTNLVTSDTTEDSLKFIFNTDNGTALSAVDLNKIVVETQENTFSYDY
jgi:hypothetical protein